MKQNGLLLIGAAALLVLLGFALSRYQGAIPASDGSATTTPEVTERTFSWRLATTESPDGVLPPRTQVALITNGDVYNLGYYAGSCAEIAQENLLPGEVSAVLCWWAGAGDEIGVFRDTNTYTVRHGIQEEGTAETAGMRGDFEDLVVIK